MKTIRSLLYREILVSIFFITLAFLFLLFFFDLTEELRSVNAFGYSFSNAFIYTALLIPTHVYELLPITALIGTILVMARFAQSSEFTILRISGLTPWLAIKSLLLLGFLFSLITFFIGEYLAPIADKNAQLLKAKALGSISAGQNGAWLKDRQADTKFAIKILGINSNETLNGISIYEFDNRGKPLSIIFASSATIDKDQVWNLKNIEKTFLNIDNEGYKKINRIQMKELIWKSNISIEMVSGSILKPERMSALNLFRYMKHLDSNKQSSQSYEIEFWKKIFYPISCLVMMALALPYAYLNSRNGSIVIHVFSGVLLGISYFLLNNIFGYMGNLKNWAPWLASALPGIFYSLISLTTFTWLVFRR